MSTQQASDQLLKICAKRRGSGTEQSLIDEKTIVICAARIGHDDQTLVTCTLEEALTVDMGKPLHSMVIPGEMYPLESEAISMHKKD